MKRVYPFTSADVAAVISQALASGNVGDSDYLILDEDEMTFSVGHMGVSDGHNRRGFDIVHFVDFDDADNPIIDENAVGFLLEMLAEGI